MSSIVRTQLGVSEDVKRLVIPRGVEQNCLRYPRRVGCFGAILNPVTDQEFAVVFEKSSEENNDPIPA